MFETTDTPLYLAERVKDGLNQGYPFVGGNVSQTLPRLKLGLATITDTGIKFRIATAPATLFNDRAMTAVEGILNQRNAWHFSSPS